VIENRPFYDILRWLFAIALQQRRREERRVPKYRKEGNTSKKIHFGLS